MKKTAKSRTAAVPLFRLEEETVNAFTHGIGALLAVAAIPPLLLRSAESGWVIWGACAIYLASQLSVYVFSTLSHAINEPARKRQFRILDQACIYLMIAGGYTPYAVAYFDGGWWWLLHVAMWTAALAGFASKVVFQHRIGGVCIALYVLLGWMPLTAIKSIIESMPAGCFAWVVAGGICYSVGVPFLAFDHKGRYMHAVWHLLVIAGSTCHYMGIYHYAAVS